MKDKIINECIKSLQKEGLKFSVDTVVRKLKISKKTVYKYFPSKETLALAMYEAYYHSATEQLNALISKKESTLFSDILHLYYDAKNMTRNEIFNKYQVNDVIRSYTEEQNDVLWATAASFLCDSLSKEESDTLRLIVDGTFEKLCEKQVSPDVVIERLVRLI